VLVGGHNCGAAAEAAAKIKGVTKVIKADNACLANGLPENMEKLILKVQSDGGFTHVMGATSAVAKGALPRVAAKLDVDQISDVIDIKGEDTFVRPIYAGNAISTLKSEDTIKVPCPDKSSLYSRSSSSHLGNRCSFSQSLARARHTPEIYLIMPQDSCCSTSARSSH
jgi:electron transfer flavoprotein alpha subunit